jgi:hypothetical protein
MKTSNLSEDITNAVNALLNMGNGQYKGNDNSGTPKSEYLTKIVLMSEDELKDECKSKIWLSAYADNNPRSNYHWQCDCCYDECARRGKKEIYSNAHQQLVNENSANI